MMYMQDEHPVILAVTQKFKWLCCSRKKHKYIPHYIMIIPNNYVAIEP